MMPREALGPRPVLAISHSPGEEPTPALTIAADTLLGVSQVADKVCMTDRFRETIGTGTGRFRESARGGGEGFAKTEGVALRLQSFRESGACGRLELRNGLPDGLELGAGDLADRAALHGRVRGDVGADFADEHIPGRPPRVQVLQGLLVDLHP